MPVRRCSNGLWAIGSGKCMYKSKSSAEKAYAAYRAIKHSQGEKMNLEKIIKESFLEVTGINYQERYKDYLRRLPDIEDAEWNEEADTFTVNALNFVSDALTELEKAEGYANIDQELKKRIESIEDALDAYILRQRRLMPDEVTSYEDFVANDPNIP